jgi:heme A synthase
MRRKTRRILLGATITLLLLGPLAGVAIHLFQATHSGLSLVLYVGTLVNVRNDTGQTLQLDCEYTHSPRLASGATALASFEPGQTATGCGVIRVTDNKRLGCVVLDTTQPDKWADHTIRISTHLNTGMQCYGE